jgi:hypothetical protein
VPFEFARGSTKDVVGSVVLDTTKANVALVVVGPEGVTSRYQATQNLKFERPARKPPDQSGLGISPEVPPLVRRVVARTPQLAAVAKAPQP